MVRAGLLRANPARETISVECGTGERGIVPRDRSKALSSGKIPGY